MHKNGYFLASTMFFDENVEFTERWRKRWDNRNDFKVDFKKQKRKIQINRAEFKSYDMPYSLNSIPKVWFYFQSTNIDYVRYLLFEYLLGIGKKIAYGNGIIDNYTIETTDFNFNTVFRPIPKRFVSEDMIMKGQSVNLMYCAYKPPYWNIDNFDDCLTI